MDTSYTENTAPETNCVLRLFLAIVEETVLPDGLSERVLEVVEKEFDI